VRRWPSAALLVLAACAADGDAAPAPGGSGKSACVTTAFEGSDFTHCTAIPGRHTIKTVLGAPPHRDLARLAGALGPRAERVAFAMNGGMYDEAGRPIGYYVEDGKRLKTLNRVAGGGNFGLLPNGVFSVEADGWHVRTADAFAATVRKRPAYATQSGPMLVIAGKLHPKLAANGESLHVRNAVGVDRAGRAHFVISDTAVSFGRLARFLRDELGCPNALYLDGSVSALWNPREGRLDRTVPLGPLILVSRVPDAKSNSDPPSQRPGPG
jgi:uncharacterized protein YigE (DUF2233 family)